MNDGLMISQLAALTYSAPMLLYAVDPALPPGQRSGKIEVGVLAASMQRGAALPLAFVLPGLMPPGALYNLVTATALSVPVGLAGSVAFWSVPPAADVVLTLSKISGGAASAVGTVKLAAGSSGGAVLSAPAAMSFAAGDVLQLATPATADTTLQSLGLTILAARG